MTEADATRTLDELAQDWPSLYERLYRALALLLSRAIETAPSRTSHAVLVKTLVSEVVAEAHKTGKALDAARTKRSVLDALRAMEAHEFGRLFLGRRGRKTRFVVWRDNVEDIAFYAALRARTGQENGAAPVPTARSSVLRHTFALRPGFTVNVELPEDLSRPEAVRLAQFLRSLPFELGSST
jgi:hypothetical protein